MLIFGELSSRPSPGTLSYFALLPRNFGLLLLSDSVT